MPEWFTGPQPAAAPARHGHGSTDPAVEARQAERIAKLRAWRCQERVAEALLRMRRAAAGSDNVVYPMKDALSAGATVGEVCDVLRDTWGTHPPAAADHAGGADPAGATAWRPPDPRSRRGQPFR
ncbi:methylmalonyl-CoA mutase family protein [Peterkaempfera bronchialis]|uniref:methylmalonyl-CoA mutase family protein n=1 Tax=Peterkaempfera bronchialis TaxID=2126346 RepID=UPI00389B3412